MKQLTQHTLTQVSGCGWWGNFTSRVLKEASRTESSIRHEAKRVESDIRHVIKDIKIGRPTCNLDIPTGWCYPPEPRM